MSMYDLAMGDGHQHDRGAVLLGLIGAPDVGRFRDAWVERDVESGEPVIAIYTRNGGGNRECTNVILADDPPHPEGEPCTGCIARKVLPAHPMYLRDADDEFDSTYATFYFRVPDDLRDVLADAAVDHVDMSEKWQAAIDAIGGSGA